jgi:two-component system sensor histidine kinase DesK
MPIMSRRADRVRRAIPNHAAGEERGRLLAQAAVYVELAVLLPIRLVVAGDVSSRPTPVHWAGQGLVVGTFAITAALVAGTRRGIGPAARWSLLVLQAVLTYLPATGPHPYWVPGTSVMLAASVPLVLASPLGWSLVVGIAGIDIALTYGIVGTHEINELVYPATATIDGGLMAFGLAALGGGITRMYAARRDLAAAAAATERLRAGSDLATAVAAPLVEARQRIERALRTLDSGSEQAAEDLSVAVGVVRQGLRRVRFIAYDHRDPGADRPADPPPTPRTAKAVLITVLSCYTIQTLANIHDYHTRSLPGLVAVLLVLAAVMDLQLRHSDVHPAGVLRPGWGWTLSLQTALAASCVALFGASGQPPLSFVVASVLLLMPRRWRWLVAAGIVGALAAYQIAFEHNTTAYLFFSVTGVAGTGWGVYLLGRLARVAVQTEDIQRQANRIAVLRERLRIARDAHDLIASGLAALAVKGDLALELLQRDPPRARDQLTEILAIAERTGADAEALAADTARVCLADEVAAARLLLTGLGAEACVDAGVADDALPRDLDAVLATVVREAVTNIIKHTAPHRVTITLSVVDDAIRLRIANDISTLIPHPRTPSGRGLANLTERLTAVGGRLTAAVDGPLFQLTATIPHNGAASEPAGLDGDTYGVGPVPGT